MDKTLSAIRTLYHVLIAFQAALIALALSPDRTPSYVAAKEELKDLQDTSLEGYWEAVDRAIQDEGTNEFKKMLANFSISAGDVHLTVRPPVLMDTVAPYSSLQEHKRWWEPESKIAQIYIPSQVDSEKWVRGLPRTIYERVDVRIELPDAPLLKWRPVPFTGQILTEEPKPNFATVHTTLTAGEGPIDHMAQLFVKPRGFRISSPRQWLGSESSEDFHRFFSNPSRNDGVFLPSVQPFWDEVKAKTIDEALLFFS